MKVESLNDSMLNDHIEGMIASMDSKTAAEMALESAAECVSILEAQECCGELLEFGKAALEEGDAKAVAVIPRCNVRSADDAFAERTARLAVSAVYWYSVGEIPKMAQIKASLAWQRAADAACWHNRPDGSFNHPARRETMARLNVAARKLLDRQTAALISNRRKRRLAGI